MEARKFLGLKQLRSTRGPLGHAHAVELNRIKSRNQPLANNDQVFRKACELSGTPPTSRQASKYRNGYGKAYPFRAQAIRELHGEVTNERPTRLD